MAESSARDQIAATARLYEREGDYERALKAWELLAEHDSRDGAALQAVVRVRRRVAQLAGIASLLDGPLPALEAALASAIDDGDYWYVVQVRRAKLNRQRSPRRLVALAGALRRSRNGESREWQEAETLLKQSIKLDPSKTSNAETYTALGALHRARGELAAARELLAELYALNATSTAPPHWRPSTSTAPSVATPGTLTEQSG